MFRDLIPELSRTYRVIAPDLPGFGLTKAPPRAEFDYTFDRLAHVVDDFVTALGLSRFALYVFDYGAPVGLRVAMAHPERITALVSQNGNAYLDGLSDGWTAWQRYWQEPSAENREACRASLSPEAIRDGQYLHGTDQALVSPDGYTLDLAYLARPEADEVQLDLVLDYRSNVALYPAFQTYFRTHRPPCLVVWGRNDLAFLTEGATAYLRDLPEAELHLLDTGHFALETHAAEIGAMMRGFLARTSTANAIRSVARPSSKVWLVTGSARGIGRAIVEAALDAGDRVVATARDPGRLSDLVARHGDRVRPVALDVTDEAAIPAAVEEAVKAFGRLDVLVNNAGYGDMAPIEDTPMASFRAQIETNLFGVVAMTRAAIPLMREQGHGHIIQFSSVGGRVGSVGRAPYSTAKWGVEGFSEVLAKEVGPLGILVTIVEPGGFRTDFAGASSVLTAGRSAYDGTVGQAARFQAEYDGRQPGDPAKAAQLVLQVAALDEPPLRLLLGSDAVRIVEASDRARSDADERWRHLSVSTDI
ncbi:MAG: Short-chain dehydrogenase/reductase [Rhizobacter sp.]|nr:Short-chain dehydrogenase/reductase [Rhizobacter sp.]